MSSKDQFIKANRDGEKLKIAIVGDAMLDEYYQVQANRISPEYPIPVELSRNDRPVITRPGGAANVAYQMANWNVDVTLWCGIDTGAWEQIQDYKFKIEPYLLKEGVKVARKRRFYDNKFPLRRWDVEPESIGSKEMRDNLFERISQAWREEKPDVVILSDYNKGTFNYCRQDEQWFAQKLVNLCRELEIPSIVDPKAGPIEQWLGCTVFKLNSMEAKFYSGKSDWKQQLSYLHNALVPDTRDHRVIVTRGGNGAVSYNEKRPRDPYWEYIPEPRNDDSSEEYNEECVIGAGDCFVSFYAMAHARGFDLEECVTLAYEAGSVYVRQRHNLPVHPSQFLDSSKFVFPSDLRDKNFKLVFTNGCFDIIHYGHIKTLEYARSLGHKLVVAVDDDASVTKLKGPTRPINVLEHRMRVLAALSCVDYVVAFHTDDLYNLIKEIQPDVLVKGGDYKKEDIVGADLVSEVQVVPLENGLSTTKITDRIKEL